MNPTLGSELREELERLLPLVAEQIGAVIRGTDERMALPPEAGVNAGEFDPVNDMVDLAREHNCWVHVDGAFGLFARVSPRTAHLVEGAERADSVSVDGHKWLNVPYDSGFAFVRDHGLLARAFRYSADYLPAEDDRTRRRSTSFPSATTPAT